MTEALNGFLVIDKPAGLTSHDCISRIRQVCRLRRVGHGGTLDPAATGVLPVALGSATRLLPFLPGDKKYRGTIQLGLHTSSDDLQGEVLACQDWPRNCNATTIRQALMCFQGTIQQQPPQISAVHVDGERAYRRVHRGETVNLPYRSVTLHSLTLLNWDPSNGQVQLEIHCSAGTYIRSLARDLGKLLGCGGCLAKLQRIQAAGFSLAQAVPLPNTSAAPPWPLPILDGLAHLPRLYLQEAEIKYWRHGRYLILHPSRLGCSLTSPNSNLPRAVAILNRDDHRALGVGLLSLDGLLRPRVVLDAIS